MKKYLNRFFSIMLLSVMVFSVGCSDDYDDQIAELNSLVSSLQDDISDINAEISAGESITNVESISNGIRITLSSGASYDITNGTDGTSGTSGTNGSIVEIVNGNWYIDGLDTGLAAAGTDGTNGTNGTDGVNGSYYAPDETTGTFVQYVWDETTGTYVKGTDSGVSFYAAGSITAVLESNGTVTLYGITDADGNSAVVTLGEKYITSLLVSEESGDGFVFDSYSSMPIATPYYLTVLNQTALASSDTYKYIVNPSSATEPESWELNAISVSTRSSSSSILKNTAVTLTNGYATVTGKFDVANLPTAAANEENRFYLQANLNDTTSVKSNTAIVDAINIENVYIGDAISNSSYRTAAVASADYITSVPSLSDVADHEILAESATGYDLMEYVYASSDKNTTTRSWLGNYNIEDYSFKFSLPTEYIGSDGVTNQQAYVTISDDSVLKVDYSTWGTSSIGRTPIVKVELMSDPLFGTSFTIATAFIKFEIVKEPTTPATPPTDITITMDSQTFSYADLYVVDAAVSSAAGSKYELTMDWTTMNQKVYNNEQIKMTHTEFEAAYDVNNPVLSTTSAIGSYGSITDLSATATGSTPTNLYGIQIDGLTGWSTYNWTVTYKAYDSNVNGDVIINHSFTITTPTETLPAFESAYVSSDGIQLTKGREVSGRHEMSVQPSEAFVSYLSDYITTETAINNTYSNTTDFTSTINSSSIAGVDLSYSTADNITDIKSQVVSLTTPLTASLIDIPMQFAIVYENGLKQTIDWTIRFENPLSVSIGTMQIATTDMATTLDVMDYITVMFNNSVVYSPSTGWDTSLQSKYGLSFDSITATTTSATGDYLDFSGTTFTWNNTGTKPIADFIGASVKVVAEGAYDNGTAYVEASTSGNLTILKY